MVATNFMGMGLPDYLWYQVTNLLFKVDQSISDDLTCEAGNGGKCKLAQSCGNYTNLWSAGWSFKVLYDGDSNYMLIPLSALAVDNSADGKCDIYLQYLNPEQDVQSDNVIFGSLITQMLVNYFKYDLVAMTTQYQFYLSDTNTLTGSYIGAANYTEGTNPFTLLHNTTQVIYINADEGRYKTTIGSNLGFQGKKQF